MSRKLKWRDFSLDRHSKVVWVPTIVIKYIRKSSTAFPVA